MELGLFSETLHFELRINSHTPRFVSRDDSAVARISITTSSVFVFGVITPEELPSGLFGQVDAFTGGFSLSEMDD